VLHAHAGEKLGDSVVLFSIALVGGEDFTYKIHSGLDTLKYRFVFKSFFPGAKIKTIIILKLLMQPEQVNLPLDFRHWKKQRLKDKLNMLY
jgi:hypothetical protein